MTRFTLACDLARKAGAILEEHRKSGLTINNKGTFDLVTNADLASEKFIVAEILKYFPGDGIIAEEGSQKNAETDFIWVIDPLDGTTSFAHGFPFYCVSIAVVDSQMQPYLGSVYHPAMNALYSAQKGYGAFRNEEQIHVSKITELKKSLLITGFPYDRAAKLPEILGRLSRVLLQVHDIRRTGSAALDFCQVALGAADGYYETTLAHWDFAAGRLIALEAGAKVTDFAGAPVDLKKGEVLATNGNIHSELMKIL